MDAAVGLIYQTALKLLNAQSEKEKAETQTAVLNAFPHPLLSQLVRLSGMVQIQQHLRNIALKLSRQNIQSAPEFTETTCDLVLVLGSKQRQQTMGWIATAMDLLSPGGRMVFCTPNNLGARAYEKRIIELAGDVQTIAKSKCRCVCVRKSNVLNTTLLKEWKAQALPHTISRHGLISQPGIFSWDRVDTGSRLLAEHLPDNLSGCGMDLGCGNGFLTVSILRRCDNISDIHLVDTDANAIACATQNLSGFSHVRVHTHWLDATTEPIPQNMDWVVLNPPFHTGKDQNIELGKTMIHAACCSLKRSGRLFVVANRKLPYELVLTAHLKNIKCIYQGGGFKVIEGTKPERI